MRRPWRLLLDVTEMRRHDLRRRLLTSYARVPAVPLWPLAREHSYLSPARLRNLERLSRRVRNLPGCFAECGVALGGSALLLAVLARRQRREVWLFDTFEGLPPPTLNDPDFEQASEWTGRCRGDLHLIRTLFERYGVWRRTHAVKGLFQDTMPGLTMPPIALLHLDGDWYDSTMTCLTHLWPKVVRGGCVQLDDYYHWQGCRKAVDEYFQGTGLTPRPIDDIGAWIQKP